jgi:large subunit ribosomal protein L29
MATTSAALLRTSTEEDLERQLKEAKEELFNLRFQAATGQLESHGRLRTVRRDIARIYTVLRERELGIIGFIEPEAPAEAEEEAPAEAEGEAEAEEVKPKKRSSKKSAAKKAKAEDADATDEASTDEGETNDEASTDEGASADEGDAK